MLNFSPSHSTAPWCVIRGTNALVTSSSAVLKSPHTGLQNMRPQWHHNSWCTSLCTCLVAPNSFAPFVRVSYILLRDHPGMHMLSQTLGTRPATTSAHGQMFRPTARLAVREASDS